MTKDPVTRAAIKIYWIFGSAIIATITLAVYAIATAK